MAGCGHRQPLPPLPSVDTSSFLPAIRNSVDTAFSAAKSKPDDPLTVGRLGMILQAHDQFSTARPCYQRAHLLDPKNFDWLYYLGTVSIGDEAVRSFRDALEIRDYLPAKLKLADVLFASGDSASAARIYRSVDHPAALFGYGRSTNDAAYYEKAIAKFPRYGAAIFALAQSYQRAGRTSEAESLMVRYQPVKTVAPPIDDPLLDAVRALNAGPSSLLRQAMNLEADGQLAAAAELNEKALALDPKLAQAHVNLVSAYGRLGEAVKAEQHFKEAIAITPNSSEAYYNFGVLCYSINRRSEAKSAFEKALVINPNYAEAHNNLGNLLQESGKFEIAARHFQKAVEIQPDFRLARFNLGRIYANQRKYLQAIAEFEKIVTADDDSTPGYLYALGATYARAGRRSDAVAVLTQAWQKAESRSQQNLAAAISRDLAVLRK